MPVSAVVLKQVLPMLANQDQLKVTVKTPLVGGAVASVTTAIGGLIAGPPGMLLGGTFGGWLASGYAGYLKPVSQVLAEMNAHQSQLLYNATRDIVDNLAIDDYSELVAFLNGGSGASVRRQLMERMAAFLRDQMHLQMAA
ncbi:protein C19orf12 homolog [Acropora millepora]|uniref:protein C19orf12 homolog n=1 Tax=Acropora millepora TaxID=45264 RepID=UPI001CF1BB1D|nr:protein C19orf12 homolog [Acropora millepora]